MIKQIKTNSPLQGFGPVSHHHTRALPWPGLTRTGTGAKVKLKTSRGRTFDKGYAKTLVRKKTVIVKSCFFYSMVHRPGSMLHCKTKQSKQREK
jgi:hypothetical protein